MARARSSSSEDSKGWFGREREEREMATINFGFVGLAM
jgi:hypothetical protein